MAVTAAQVQNVAAISGEQLLHQVAAMAVTAVTAVMDLPAEKAEKAVLLVEKTVILGTQIIHGLMMKKFITPQMLDLVALMVLMVIPLFNISYIC